MDTVEMRDILFSNLRSYVNHDLDCFDKKWADGYVSGKLIFAYYINILSTEEYSRIRNSLINIYSCREKEDFELAKKALLDKIDDMQVPFN